MGAGDVNGDGYDDVIVGVPRRDLGGIDAGAAYIYFGGPAADETVDVTLVGEAAGDRFGAAVSGAGDVNGDGYDDVIVGAQTTVGAFVNAGVAHVYYGGSPADAVEDLTFSGEGSYNYFGSAVSGAGDVNGDGYDDLLVGASYNSSAASFAGRAYVFYGGPAEDLVADLIFDGEGINNYFGNAVSGAGDVNGDGFADVIIGAYKNSVAGSYAGRAYVFYGGASADAIADLVFTGEDTGDNLGNAVSGGGDVNGDGYDDVIVGVQRSSVGASGAGAAYLYFGGPSADAVPDYMWRGEGASENFGKSVSVAGNVDGDRFADLIVGADRNDAGAYNGGRAFLFAFSRYRLTSPLGGETWPVGSLQPIAWAGDDPADLSLSVDGGMTFDRVRSGVGGEDENSVELRVPHTPTRFAMIKVTPSDPALAGEVHSDSFFTIQ